MSRRRSIGGWLTGALAIALFGAAIALLTSSDEASPSSVVGASPRTLPASPGQRASRPPAATRTDAASVDSSEAAPPSDPAPVHAPAPATTAELTDADLRGRLAAGEAGMEVLASRLPESSQSVALAPRWQPGDEWLVETWYRQMQAHEESWSGPALWRFRVEREVSFNDEPCLELVVTRADEPQVAPVTLWISRAAGRLAGVETTVVQQGKASRSLYTPARDGEVAAVRPPVTSAPLRLPPLGALATVAPRGQPFDRLPVETPPDAPAAADLVGAGGDYLDVEFADPLDGTTVRQRWSPGDLRWPVVSRTETTVSVRRS